MNCIDVSLILDWYSTCIAMLINQDIMTYLSNKYTIAYADFRVKALKSGSVLNTGNMFLYTMMSGFAAFGRIEY